MGKSIPAIVTPEVLSWARGLDKITVDEIAQKSRSIPLRYYLGKRVANTLLWYKLKTWPNNTVFHLPISIYPIRLKRQKGLKRLTIGHLATWALVKCLVS